MNYSVILLLLSLTGSFSLQPTAKSCDGPLSCFNIFHGIETRDDKGNEIDINEFLIEVIENFKDDMTEGIPNLKIPILDPFRPPKPFNLDVNDDKAVVQANFSEIEVRGLSEFELDYLDANMSQLTLRFKMHLPRVFGNGTYALKGMVIKIVPLRGNGGFWIEPKNLTLIAQASMEKLELEDGSLRLQLDDDFDVHIDFDDVKMDMENFLGGGRWTEVLKKILNDMSKNLFKKFLPQMKNELNKSLLKVINKQLMKIPLTLVVPGSSADDYVDEILINVKRFIQENQYDPMILPDYTSNFSKKVAFIDVYGEARLFDGWLSGISSIHRTEHCTIDANRTTISISAHLGLNNLQLKYRGNAHFMTVGPSIECGGSIEEVSFNFTVLQSNRKGSTPHLKEIEIINMSTIWIELSGLGPLTWIMKWLLTGITKLVEGFVVEKVTNSLHEYLEEEFQKVSFPV